MLRTEQVNSYLEEMQLIPKNLHYESIDIFGKAVEHIKEAVNSERVEDIHTVMDTAVELALAYTTKDFDPESSCYIARTRSFAKIYITELEVANFVNYIPKRLSNFIKGFQAEAVVNLLIGDMESIEIVSGRMLDLLIKTKYSIEGDFSADMQHHIDCAIQYKKKLYLIHIFQESSQHKVQLKLKAYMRKKKCYHILEGRHAITYGKLSDLTEEYITNQLHQIFQGDRSIKIKPDGTVQFLDF